MINVTDAPYYANPSTGVSNYTAIMAAIQAAIDNGGDEVYFPPGRYEIQGSGANQEPIYKTGANKIKLYGEGAIIDCDTETAVTGAGAGTNGKGGGFTLLGDNIVVEGLRFEGNVEVISEADHQNGKLLRLSGDDNTVRNCYFKDGNGGAVWFQGDNNLIIGNIFNKCNNYSDNGDYGAIHIPGSSKYATISENKIFDQFYSGISAYGTGTSGDIAYIDIINNYIRSNSSSSTVGHSMGVFLNNGANDKIRIESNTIEKIDAEGIIIVSNTSWKAKQCIIANNIIRDCDYQGISLNSEGAGGTFTDFSIMGNIIENTSSAQNYDHHIFLSRVQDSIISNNKCIGIEHPAEGPIGEGISLNNSPTRVQISDNQLRTFDIGIKFWSADSALKDNHVYDCDTGINLSYCKGSSVVGNIVNRCVTGVTYGTSSAPLHIVANAILECTNRYSGTVAPELLSHSGRADSGSSSYSSFVVEGTLVAGEADVLFYHVYSGDRFIVVPNNEGSDTEGALYVSMINVNASKVNIKSTLDSDTRSFTVIKIISAG